ncbi:unnamed protein product [Prorocentrum cordatum]|uniref:Uncharacterized protein n=1 Tax=Prorocentrum cordatum TaxID=2364126 RepID=A0ABN9TJW3_9DINO|nr:unnamed protein product [Polarella glacialis]
MHVAMVASMPQRNAVGVALLPPVMSQSQFDEGVINESIRSSELIESAIKPASTDERDATMLVISNIRNVGLPQSQASSITARIRVEARVAMDSPEKVAAFVMGDMSVTVDAPMHRHAPEIGKRWIVEPRRREYWASWRDALSESVELDG